MTVYIDVLFVVNLIINYFILLAVSQLMHRRDKRLRIFLGALFGALYAVFMFFPQVRFLYSAILKLLVSMGIVLISYKISGIKNFCAVLMYFYVISMLFGGVIYAVQYFAAPPILSVRNGITYLDISPLFLIVSSAGCYVLVSLFSRFFHRNTHTRDIYSIRIESEGMAADMKALLDNGNSLTDAISGKPVIIAEYEKVKKLIPEMLRETFKNGGVADPKLIESAGYTKRYRVVPFKSVGSAQGILPAFHPDSVKIIGTDQTCTDLLVAVTGRRLSDDGLFNALLNPALTYAEDGGKTNDKSKIGALNH